MDAALHFHLTASTLVIAKYLCVQSVSIDEALMWIRRLAIVYSGVPEQHLVAELEAATGMPIADLAELTKKGLPRG